MMRLLLNALMTLALLAVAGCNISAPRIVATSTNEAVAIATATPLAEPSVASASPTSISPTATAATATPSPIHTPSATLIAASPTATLPYFEYLVGEGETLFYILQLPQHGYGYEPNVAATVVAMNANVPNADSVRGGITIRIPRPTLTPTPLGAQATQALLATIGADDSSGVVLPSGAALGCHIVEAGDAIIGVAVQNNTTLEILHGLNRDLNWFGCNFTLPSGGENCAPNLRIGQCVRVPLPTPTSTKFPTPTGMETATPTATKLAPRLLYPLDGQTAPRAPLLLQWVGLSGMNERDEYLVELVNQTTNQALRSVTRDNSFQAPAAFMPGDGQTHDFQWRVSVAQVGEQSIYSYVGAEGQWRSFRWSGA
ncbi:MAG: hypothetical protein F4X02_13410 [Chloroflexi bacterium]|nr:hypothetical protein [Chloroflexota bacterium]